jgi:eukaryotic-like serine/threonine-protein kinase
MATPGVKLGTYELNRLIGAGGMGEVYLAYDSRLGRNVAVKVLPNAFSADELRLRRFVQEARAAAALNHPNILDVHDLGSDNGQTFIVSEFLEGETLRAKLGRGELPVRKAIDFAIQIASGLAAAHDKGIVHRDLKPENIFVTNDGRVKILDFGLAKLRESSSASDTQTLPRVVDSEPGVVLGTAGYMSPEQVRGQTVDARTDIFALGAVLYEMLSGKRAFHGETAVETMSAIMKQDPPELLSSHRHVGPALDRIVRRCLEKERHERFQTASDVAFALDAVSGSGSAVQPVFQPTGHKRTHNFVAVLLAIVLVASLGALVVSRTRVQTPEYHQLTFRLGAVSGARFAPDGIGVVYAAAWGTDPIQLFSTRSDSNESRSLGLPPADLLGVSRTGDMAILLNPHRVLTWIREGTLARVPLAGGAPRAILEHICDGDISPDGTQFAVVRPSAAGQRLEWPVGNVRYETRGYISDVRLSPAGDAVAFFDHPIYGDDSGHVAIIDAAGHKRTISAEYSGSTRGIAWAQSGNEVWFVANRSNETPHLRAVNLKGRERVLLAAAGGIGISDIASDGRVLMTDVYTRSRVFFTSDKNNSRDLSWLSDDDIGGLSSDGKIIALTEYTNLHGDAYTVMFRPTDGAPAVAIGNGYAVAVSPDGKWVAATDPQDDTKIMLLPTGPGESRRVNISPVAISQAYRLLSWTPAGIVFAGREQGRNERAYVLEPTMEKVRSITGDGVHTALLSPSGTLVYASGPDIGHVIVPVGGGHSTPLHLEPSESVINWDDSGKRLYVWSGQFPGRVFLLDVSTGSRKLWREVSPPDATGLLFGRMLVTPDGHNVLYRYRQWLSELYVATQLR